MNTDFENGDRIVDNTSRIRYGQIMSDPWAEGSFYAVKVAWDGGQVQDINVDLLAPATVENTYCEGDSCTDRLEEMCQAALKPCTCPTCGHERFERYCTRRRGHQGPHVTCNKRWDRHNIAHWEIEHEH